jgi:ribosomal lysine N-methyltransferase 2
LTRAHPITVNTRCVYHRVSPSPSHPDNLTLCPLLDLANHTSSPAHASRTPIPTFYSPSTSQLNKGDEVYLRYGPHSNITLFAEYGFVEENPSNGGQLDVSDILELLFHKKGPLGAWMKTSLEATNYWGYGVFLDIYALFHTHSTNRNWTLHDTPGPPHPSYRLLPALRLLQLSPQVSPGASSNDPTYDSPELKIWHETILGEKDFVSPDNERMVWRQLSEICGIAAKRAEEGLDRLQQACRGKDLDSWRAYAVKAIRILWLEEKRVSAALIQSIESGQAID